MKIHAIQTGVVRVRARQREGVGTGTRRRLNTMLDREWTDWLPIYAFAIEHPDGVIVVDTGETTDSGRPGYFPRWHPYYRLSVRLAVEPEQEIGPRLRALGIEPRDVRSVVLTHLHTDHAGGLHHFQGVDILAARAEINGAQGFSGRVNGYPNNRWPVWFAPSAVRFDESRPLGAFPASAPLTEAGDVVAVPLPGHTPGHIGVAVELGDCRLLLAGDASYTQELMVRGAVDGVAPDDEVAKRTLARIQSFVSERPTVYLVAHDPESATRLAERQAVSGSGVGAGVTTEPDAGSANVTS